MTIPRTPLFYVEVDLSSSSIVLPIFSDLTAMVGEAAKVLHVGAQFNPNMKALVFKHQDGHYSFDFYRNNHRITEDGLIVATLTALTDNRVRVTYFNGRESETLYL